MSVVPEPPKASTTISPLLADACSIRSTRPTGFMVGWDSDRFGFSWKMTEDGCSSSCTSPETISTVSPLLTAQRPSSSFVTGPPSPCSRTVVSFLPPYQRCLLPGFHPYRIGSCIHW
ncbi:hypothetical protein D3C79_863770 [compost metagenome]